MSGARPFIISILLVIVGTLMMLLFMQSFVAEKNPTSQVFSANSSITSSISNLEASANQFKDISKSVQYSFNDSKPSPIDYVFLIFVGAFEIPKATFTFIVDGISTIATTGSNMGVAIGQEYPKGGGIINTLFMIAMAGLILTGVFLLIKAIRSGETEGR